MSEEVKAKPAPAKPPPRAVKPSPNGENKVPATNGVETNGARLRPMSEAFTKADLEKGQLMHKLPPRQKYLYSNDNMKPYVRDGTDSKGPSAANTSGSNLLSPDAEPPKVDGDASAKPAAPRRPAVQPPTEGEAAKPKPPAAKGPAPLAKVPGQQPQTPQSQPSTQQAPPQPTSQLSPPVPAKGAPLKKPAATQPTSPRIITFESGNNGA